METRLLVRKDRLQDAELRSTPPSALAPGQARLRVARYALTANNITYAAFGAAMHYWDFFPAAETGWGCIPVWGFADVVQSLHPGVAVGERVYGYFPMGTHLVVAPGHLSPEGFGDTAAHRAELPRVYNRYLRCAADPWHAVGSEDLQALLRPLFTTSWLIDDFLADNGFFGARTVLLSSASSKTAYGTAFALAQRGDIAVVGLTSAANRAFCEGLGCYRQVLAYEELAQLAADTACVYVDFAGNAALRQAVHARFGALAYSCAVGGTHVSQLGNARELPGPRPVLFFAPAQVAKRRGEWGAAQLEQRLLQGWRDFQARVADPAWPWIAVQQHTGMPAAQAAYLQLLAGSTDPRCGHMVTP